MRLATSLILIATAATVFSAVQLVSAKGALEVSPPSGPPGATIRVHGIGAFQPDYHARIILVPAADFVPPPGSLMQYSNESDLPDGLLLATVQPDKNYSFDVRVTIPSTDVIADALGGEPSDLKIVAIGRNDQLGGFFALNAVYTLTNVTAPAAGTGDGDGGLLAWPLWASLGVVSAACIAAGWRFRTSRREVRNGDAAQRGREGPRLQVRE